MKRILVVICALSTIAFASTAMADGSFEFGGKFWSSFKYDLTKDAGGNLGFDLDRVYMQPTYKFDDNWSASAQLDAVRGESSLLDTTGTTKAKNYFYMYLRNAFVQYKGCLGEGSVAKVGLISTLWIDSMDGVAKTRWLAKGLLDDGKVLTSRGGGISTTGKAGDIIDYGVLIHNGSEGLTKPGNSDNALAAGAQVTLHPVSDGDLKGLGVSVYDEFQMEGKTAGVVTTPSKNVIAGALLFNHDFADLAAEFTTFKPNGAAAGSTGYGARMNFKLADVWSLFARFYTGNDAFKAGMGAGSILTLGPTYSFMKGKIETAILYETMAAVVSGGTAKSGLAWKWQANF